MCVCVCQLHEAECAWRPRGSMWVCTAVSCHGCHCGCVFKGHILPGGGPLHSWAHRARLARARAPGQRVWPLSSQDGAAALLMRTSSAHE